MPLGHNPASRACELTNTDTPGHCLGHMCSLARTTAGKDSTFLLLGGDICHFVGDLRPNKSYPIPDPIPDGVLDSDAFFPNPCPCSIFTDHHPVLSDDTDVEKRRTTPWYQVSDHEKSAYVDPPAAQSSVDKLVGFERCPDVLICLSHDSGLLRHLPTLNSDPKSDLNNWRKNNWKEQCRWEWLNELPRHGKPGRKSIVEGLWRDGKPSDGT